MSVSENPYVLIIEDDVDMIELVQMVLEAQHMDVQGALDGGTGLAMMHERRPDAVLLDLMLPDMVGWKVYQEMQADPALSRVPVIVVTAQDTPIDRLLGEHVAKVRSYITKPFSPRELREAVAAALIQETD